ncbi:coproporphyrinogen oxidase [Arachidicoccus rhizosphaerae]|uniref:coproporphyrinogen oxidase n=2 Tax=Arachidicoccus rhizosphaerae TaxID=551991 RepID=A0A1H3VLX5_9BACT|nr:oxygen-dependent coproporphyrinogen oxidase [Arachidicoccus rhizosphaerae]SDZ75128.1 coproporphyrinogen oxidase [Arachidicoccus rhizosphaerae]
MMEMKAFKLAEVPAEMGPSADGFRERWCAFILSLQNNICAALEKVDGLARFTDEQWARGAEAGQSKESPGQGGGRTRIITSGHVFEKGGVNTSIVHGQVTEAMRQGLGMDGDRWFAAGISLVIHPANPFVATTHANWRYFELYDADGRVIQRWFGGGADLTPYYLFEQDARHFHGCFKTAMDPFGSQLYPAYKNWCDQYFNNKHRGFEMRGIGGVFYDHLVPGQSGQEHPVAFSLEKAFDFQRAVAEQFIPAYIPIVEKRAATPFTEKNTYWQQIRRGRYVEFNLIHDRGTLFGLKTNGRTESILMSLPPQVRFDYNFQPEPGSEEQKLLDACRHPKDWA